MGNPTHFRILLAATNGDEHWFSIIIWMPSAIGQRSQQLLRESTKPYPKQATKAYMTAEMTPYAPILLWLYWAKELAHFLACTWHEDEHLDCIFLAKISKAFKVQLHKSELCYITPSGNLSRVTVSLRSPSLSRGESFFPQGVLPVWSIPSLTGSGHICTGSGQHLSKVDQSSVVPRTWSCIGVSAKA